MEQTLIILKPDAVKRKLVGEILSRFEKKNFNIKHLKMERLKPEVLKEHYAHHSDKPFFGELINYMTEAEVVLGVIEGPDVVEHVRNMLGKTNALEAAPGTIRGDYAFATTQNLMHASDSLENAQVEIKRFFSEFY